MAEPVKFLGAIGRALQRFAKKTPDAFQVPVQGDHLSLRYAREGHPLQIMQDANNASVSDPRLRWWNNDTGRESQVTKPSIQWAYEPWAERLVEDDPLDARTIAALTSTKAKSLGDPLLVPRMYKTAWDVLEEKGAYDRNPFGGLTESNLTRKAPFLQSYLLQRGRKAPHVELHPNLLKAEEITPTVGGDSPWKVDQLGHDEGRYGALQQLRQYLEAQALPAERRIKLDRDYQNPERQLKRFSRGDPERLENHTNWRPGYTRGWETLNLDEQIGALGLSEAGMLSRLLESQGHGVRHDRALWPDEAPWTNTLKRHLSGGALSDLASRGIGDRVQKRSLMTDWLYRQAQRGRDPEELVDDAGDYGRGIFYAKGGPVKMAGGGPMTKLISKLVPKRKVTQLDMVKPEVLERLAKELKGEQSQGLDYLRQTQNIIGPKQAALYYGPTTGGLAQLMKRDEFLGKAKPRRVGVQRGYIHGLDEDQLVRLADDIFLDHHADRFDDIASTLHGNRDGNLEQWIDNNEDKVWEIARDTTQWDRAYEHVMNAHDHTRTVDPFKDVQRLRPTSPYFTAAVRERGMPSPEDVLDMHFANPEQLGHVRGSVTSTNAYGSDLVRPNSSIMFLEELQSDPGKMLQNRDGFMKGQRNEARMKNIHRLLAGSMLERGLKTPELGYMATPSPENIASVRGGNADRYSGIYDRELAPLIKEYGATMDGGWNVFDLDRIRQTGKFPIKYSKGGPVKRIEAALKRWMKTPNRQEYRPTELYMPLSKGEHVGSWAYRDPQEAARILEGLDEAALAPLLLRRQPPGGSGLLNRYTDEGDKVLITDPSATRMGFAKGGLAQMSRGGIFNKIRHALMHPKARERSAPTDDMILRLERILDSVPGIEKQYTPETIADTARIRRPLMTYDTEALADIFPLDKRLKKQRLDTTIPIADFGDPIPGMGAIGSRRQGEYGVDTTIPWLNDFWSHERDNVNDITYGGDIARMLYSAGHPTSLLRFKNGTPSIYSKKFGSGYIDLPSSFNDGYIEEYKKHRWKDIFSKPFARGGLAECSCHQ